MVNLENSLTKLKLRPDQRLIAEIIESNSRVIDIGCGRGKLLSYLSKNKNIRDHGIEMEFRRVGIAVSQGLSVVQGDADSDLQYYPDSGFDYAILGLTLQVMKHPKDTLEEALRIAKKVIVAIPNFGHMRNRLYLCRYGRMPVTETLSYQWYETPNIHFCTIKDMLALAKELECNVEASYALYKNAKVKTFTGDGSFCANLFAEHGIFILSRK